MWIATRLGFFSVVSAPKNRHVQIRARVREDLVALLQSQQWGTKHIICTPHADYRYRVVIPTTTWVLWAQDLATDCAKYPNFKSEVAKTNPRRAEVYTKVWATLCSLENEEL